MILTRELLIAVVIPCILTRVTSSWWFILPLRLILHGNKAISHHLLLLVLPTSLLRWLMLITALSMLRDSRRLGHLLVMLL